MTLTLTLQHRFDDFELDLDVIAGDGVTAIFGPSGSGKTTIIRAVAGLLRPDAGRIQMGDRVLFDHNARTSNPLTGASVMFSKSPACSLI
jgi:molybdate transport system ATP-binding protein